MVTAESVIGKSRGRRRRFNAGSFGMLALSLVAALCVLSMLTVVLWLSFVDGLPGDPHLAYAVTHYREILLDSFTYRVLGNTALFSLISLVVAMLFGLPLSWLMERTDFPGKAVVFTLMTVGLLVPGFAVALGWIRALALSTSC